MAPAGYPSPHMNGMNGVGHGINGTGDSEQSDGELVPIRLAPTPPAGRGTHRGSISGLRAIMQPGEQVQRHPTQSILAGTNPNIQIQPTLFSMDGPDARPEDLESTEGSGHGTPVHPASPPSPATGTVPRPLTAANLFLNDHNNDNTADSSANASSSNMAEIITRARPRPTGSRPVVNDLPARNSEGDFNQELPSPALGPQPELTTPIFVDYTALLVPKDAPLMSTAQQLSMSPMSVVIIDVAASHSLTTVLANVRNEILEQGLSANEREVVVQRGGRMKLLAVLSLGDRVGSSIVVDDASLRRCLSLMARRGWNDYFAIKVAESAKGKDDNDGKKVALVDGDEKGKCREANLPDQCTSTHSAAILLPAAV